MEWISVEERLPEKGVEVWTWTIDVYYHSNPGGAPMVLTNHPDYPWHNAREHYSARKEEITHWMPLPDPPKEEGRSAPVRLSKEWDDE